MLNKQFDIVLLFNNYGKAAYFYFQLSVKKLDKSKNEYKIKRIYTYDVMYTDTDCVVVRLHVKGRILNDRSRITKSNRNT